MPAPTIPGQNLSTRSYEPMIASSTPVELPDLKTLVMSLSNMRQLFKHYLDRNSFKGLRDLCAQSMGIYALLRSDD
ncbi:hypothetical protein L202_04259 [Cryptococcus amylolentus CBS 6039]|uniref:Uncharacterized protein n=1 Tax=Cryptococcus amylolentus CBS 6039 TaxID=1295533 RepID=A0A1E3HQS6_9TREE|nr:hypothetical protein L202_04259 [Cryptococcus amylolentus CBS 6039]ODN78677.1 hypothetical protein L202_04259 [Cryptococcus amylolentus CBS 6039]